MNKAWILAMLLLLPVTAGAAKRSEILKQVESSLVVTGTIETRADGTVSSTVVDKPEKLPAGVADFVKQQVAGWKFEPVMVDGQAHPARSPISVRLVAKRLDDDKYSIAIRNASIDGTPPQPSETLEVLKLTPPSYPQSVAMSGASGVVYLVLKVGKDGHVIDAFAELVNLKTIGLESEMKAWRKSLAGSALQAARKWTFLIPSKGPQVDDEYWLARVPVQFYMDKNFVAAYGKWEVYLPGVRQPVPWGKEDRPGFSPDALADGGIYLMGKPDTGPKLLTPLDGT